MEITGNNRLHGHIDDLEVFNVNDLDIIDIVHNLTFWRMHLASNENGHTSDYPETICKGELAAWIALADRKVSHGIELSELKLSRDDVTGIIDWWKHESETPTTNGEFGDGQVEKWEEILKTM